MLYISNQNTNPYFNIATEEYLLKNIDDDIFMLYRNESSIIVGKHQNTFAEINYWFVKNNHIHVIRRLSGGGTVFHDLGNINFTFIRNGSEGALVDFVKFTEPIIAALKNMGVPATRSGRNDILVEGLKISGNAEHVYKNRTLHHGTLLFSSKLEDLKQGLKSNSDSFKDKAVKSVRSSVVNISKYLQKVSIDTFVENLQSTVFKMFPEMKVYSLTSADIQQINQLVLDKYSTWNWNYGYSPRFEVKKTGLIKGNSISVILEIEKGIISNISIQDQKFENFDLILQLRGTPYNDESVFQELQKKLTTEEIKPWLTLLF